jgi:hypothetical protein
MPNSALQRRWYYHQLSSSIVVHSSEQFGNKKYSLQHDVELKKKINKTGHSELPS